MHGNTHFDPDQEIYMKFDSCIKLLIKFNIHKFKHIRLTSVDTDAFQISFA